MQFSLDEGDGKLNTSSREHFVTPMALDKSRLTRGAKALEEDDFHGDTSSSDTTLDTRAHLSNRAASAAMVGSADGNYSEGERQEGVSVLEEFEDFTLPGSLGDNERGVVLIEEDKTLDSTRAVMGMENNNIERPLAPSPSMDPTPPLSQSKESEKRSEDWW